MTIYGYCRASTVEQSTSIQEDAIRARYPEAKIRSEKRSGTSRKGRDELQTLLDFMDEGDTLVVQRQDRLARSLVDLINIVDLIEAKGAFLTTLDAHIDTTNASGKMLLQVMGAVNEFETALRRERQLAGIAKAKSEGRYKGRKPVAGDKVARAMELVANGATKEDAAAEVGMGVSTLYRRLKAG